MSLSFEWDPHKATSNAAKHGVTFQEALSAFSDPFSVTIDDPDHSLDEDRYVLLGRSSRGKLLVVVHTIRGDNIRIISARVARRRERRQYEGTEA
jgi:hypothetical protein